MRHFCVTHGVEYKQGMNEVVAPFVHVFRRVGENTAEEDTPDVGSPFEVSPRILRLGGQSPWHHPPSQFNPGHETQRHQAKNGYIDFPDVKGGRDTPNMGSKSKAASAFLNAGEILSVMPMSSILKRDRTKMLDEILEKDSKDSGSLKLLIGSDSDWLKFVVDKYSAL